MRLGKLRLFGVAFPALVGWIAVGYFVLVGPAHRNTAFGWLFAAWVIGGIAAFAWVMDGGSLRRKREAA